MMLIVTLLQVVSRYIFTPIGWTEELARYAYIWLVYLGSAALHYHKEHITLDWVYEFLRQKITMVFGLIINVLILYTSYLVILSGYKFTKVMGRAMGTALPVRLKYIYVIIPLGFILISIFTLADIGKIMKNLFKKT